MLAEPLVHGGVSAGQVAVASIVVLVVATMFVLDDARSFRAGTRGCDEEGRAAQVFGLLARGRSIPYIRDELVISRETAATHAKHIYAKLDVHSRQELIDLVAKTN